MLVNADSKTLCTLISLVTFFFSLQPGGLTLQQPVDLAVVGQPLQRRRHGRQVDSILLQGLAAAPVLLDGPLQGGQERGGRAGSGQESSQATVAAA